MTHDELRESAAAYVLGALSGAERAEFEAHVATCASCAAEVRSLSQVAGGLAMAAPSREPSAALRARVLGSVSAPSRSPIPFVPRGGAGRPLAWLAAAAAILCVAAAGWYGNQLRGRIASLDAQLRDTRQVAEMAERRTREAGAAVARGEQARAILSATDVARIRLVGQPVSPGAGGQAFWSPTRGLLVTADGLPALPPGKVYQLWMVTPASPISAGLLRPDEAGTVEVVVPSLAGVTLAKAVAVTLEPEGGVPAPTGAKYLVGVVGG